MSIFMNSSRGPIIYVFLWLLIFLIVDFSICSGSSDVLCIATEREALLEFKKHLADPSNRLHSWDGEQNCCKWPEIVCSNLTGHVLELHLRSSPPDDFYFYDSEAYQTYERSRFGGEISPSLLGLKHLNYIDLSGNNFGSAHIPNFFGLMSNLTHLNLSNANFGGTIPHQIGNLSNLCYLNLHGNDLLHAKNLHWLLHLSSLQYLDLSSANLSKASDWLQIVQSLPSLMELHLSDCDLIHDFHPSRMNFSSLVILDLSYGYSPQPLFPCWIFELRNLVSLKMTYSYFQGSIPDGIQNFTRLENLDLSGNFFNSSIPIWLYSFTHLKFLNLGYNNLCGTISDAIGNLASLINLNLEGNQLEGKFPRTLGNLFNLREVYLSSLKSNQDVSEILKIFSRVSPKLEALSVTDSKLPGHLSDDIGIFQNLNILDLSDNSIGGSLPRSLGKLSSLTSLSLGSNQFIGNPFEILRSLVGLQDLSIGDNLFQGVVKEAHLANLTRLRTLVASGNQLALKVSPEWIPSFQVLELDVSSWHLGPRFPSWIESQKNLDYLSISNTSISDSIPTWLWNSSHNRVRFFLSHNQIYGELPNTPENPITFEVLDLRSNCLNGQLPFISPIVNQLDLSSNQFSGTITNFLCQNHYQWNNLESLNLASNNLSGKIPDCWMNWKNMTRIELGNNHFTGTIPTSLQSLASLKFLHLRQNKLSGMFPTSLRDSKQLVALDLGENKFSGIIPTWVGERLLNLKFLSLDSNNFYGKIPWHICTLKFLQVLDISQNNLSGPIPKCIDHFRTMSIGRNGEDPSIYWVGISVADIIGSFIRIKGTIVEYDRTLGLLTAIDLSNNKLSGNIPKEITSLKGLLFLNMSKNNLRGQIPENIGSMRSLLHIDFSRNQLFGEIPQSITNLSFLSYLDLSFNYLKGQIPIGTQLQTFEASSFIGNELCGPPLPNNCIPHGSTHGLDRDEQVDGGHGINWFYVSMAMGFIVGFWGVVGPLFWIRSWRYAYYQFFDNIWYKLLSML